MSYPFAYLISPYRSEGQPPGKEVASTTTARFAQLLMDAQTRDKRHRAMYHAHVEFLTENFCFADTLCLYVTSPHRQEWDIPRVACGRLYTQCG
jgi:hypothetical protein